MPKRRWDVLLTVTERTKQIEEGIEDRRVFRFKMLPFIALEGGHPWASNPPAGTRVTPFTETSYALAWAINRELLEASHLARTWAPNGNRWVLGSDSTPSYPILEGVDSTAVKMLPLIENVRIAHPCAISLSLQLRQGRVLADDDILSITTRVASRSMPLLVAAGNWGIYGEGSLSPLAKLPWTIAVGATRDEAGTERLPESSVGVKGSDLRSGVTVVAYGENSFTPGKFGTSFADAASASSSAYLDRFRAADEANRFHQTNWFARRNPAAFKIHYRYRVRRSRPPTLVAATDDPASWRQSVRRIGSHRNPSALRRFA